MSDRPFELVGLDGTNPLGFLAAVGALVTLDRTGERAACLRWVRRHTWIPVLEHISQSDEEHLARAVAEGLSGRAISPDAERCREAARRELDAARKAVKKKRDEIRKRRLSRSELAGVRGDELHPLEEEERARRDLYIQALRQAVPRAELALGRRIEDATAEDYRELAQGLLRSEGEASRDELDQLAALASDACLDRGRLEATPFEFTKGSGWQFFLDDVRQLIGKVTPGRVREVLFDPWKYRDEGLSLRWDPIEDRRYALLDRDPNSPENRPTTVWMANLLAYHALALFPCAPTRLGLGTPAWRRTDDGEWLFTWPLWQFPAILNTVASLLRLSELTDERPNTAILRARGVVAVYRAQRTKVGQGMNSKLNFAPARAVL
jgi:hypothetical protein